MTSYVEITLWGGLPAPKKEAVDTFLPLSMATNVPPETFFDILSQCRSTRILFEVIDNHYRGSRNPHESPDARRYHNPTEYQITQIAVFKRRLVIQHEGFVFMVHHQPPEPHTAPPEPDFLIAIDRNIDATPPRSIFSFAKFVIDRVNCSLVHPMAPQSLERLGTFRRPLLWLMPAPEHEYQFNLNLLQVDALLEAIHRFDPNPQYHAMRKNCFWHSRIIRTVIRDIIQSQQPQGNNVIVVAHEPHVRGLTLGRCFWFHLDAVDEEEPTTIFDRYTRLHNLFLTA